MKTENMALALLNSVRIERGFEPLLNISRLTDFDDEALCRAIEQHEAFRQEVSNIVNAYVRGSPNGAEHEWESLKSLIIPTPKPDPLVDVAKMMGYFNTTANHWAEDVSAALDALGFEIREKNDG